MPLDIGFIGAGLVGTTLAVATSRRGSRVTRASSRSIGSAERLASLIDGCVVVSPQEVARRCDLVFVTVPDAVIEEVARSVRWRPGQSVVHCSGALGATALSPARESGASVGGFHPLQSFVSVDGALESLHGTAFAIEAGEPLRTVLVEMAASLGGEAIHLGPEDKMLYHASAVLALNSLMAGLRLATSLVAGLGLDEAVAQRALLGLVRGAVRNVSAAGLSVSLTGPIARGDAGMVRRHVEALGRASSDALSLYRRVGLATVPLGLARGTLPVERANEIEKLLRQERSRGERPCEPR